MRCVGPDLEEHRSLQNKLIAVDRLAEAVAQALKCVASKNQAEILAITGGDVEEFLANRRRDIPGTARVQASASRYGLITFATRQTLAACHRSSIVAFRSRRHSRSASIATSRPILFRYLKQSATVLAIEKTRVGTPSMSCISWPNSSDSLEQESTPLDRKQKANTHGIIAPWVSRAADRGAGTTVDEGGPGGGNGWGSSAEVAGQLALMLVAPKIT